MRRELSVGISKRETLYLTALRRLGLLRQTCHININTLLFKTDGWESGKSLRRMRTPSNQHNKQRSRHRQSAINKSRRMKMLVHQIPLILGIQHKQARDTSPRKRRQEMAENKVSGLRNGRFNNPEEEDRGRTKGGYNCRRVVDVSERCACGHDGFD